MINIRRITATDRSWPYGFNDRHSKKRFT